MKKICTAFFAVVVMFVAMGATCESKSEGVKEMAVQGTESAKAVTEAAKTAGEPIAVLETTKGVIKFRFFTADAPKTCENFIKLAVSNFYNGLTFHRVEPGFVIQGGDPAGNGTGGPGYNIKAEFNKNPHLDGTVAMARAQDPDSAGSQFYICLAAVPFLDGKYTVFGQVTEGLDVVHKIVIGDKMTKVYIEYK
jgi:cyclophilin family peptidyl-prolyl cis-trans isomerase